MNIVSDYEYKCPAHVFSEDVSKSKRNIFTYLYDYRSSTSAWPVVFNGAAHSDELEFVFDIGNGISYRAHPALAKVVLHINWRRRNNIVFDIWTGGNWGSQTKEIIWQWQRETLRTDIVVDDDTINVSHFSVGR